jgi:Ca-activated chloride channel family protein
LLLLLVSFSLEFPVRIKPRHLGPAQPPPVLPTAAATERRPPPLPPRVASLILLAALLVLPANAQEKAKADGPSTPLGHAVQRISAKVELLAGDCKELAVQTIKWGETIKSSGQPIPDGPLRDGIDAVDAGALLNEKAADWGDLRRQLEALREKQDQKKDDQQQEKKDDEKKDQQQKQDKDQKQDQQKDQKDQKQEQKDSSKDKSQEKQDQKKEEPKDEKNSEQKEQQKQQDSAFGDMKKPDPQKQPPPPKPEEMQQIAPKDEKKEGEKIDPALAMPLEQLEKVKNNDAPGRLFQLMEGERKPGQQPANKKNW